MKKILKLVLAITMILIYSCNSTPMIGNSDHPFIVTSIKSIYNGMCIYTGTLKSTDNEVVLFWQDPDICLPCRLYQVGDTIKPENMISSDTIKINQK
jgi:hypothetical protein